MNPFESILGGQSFQIDEQKHSSIEHGGEQPSCKSRGAHQSNGHAPDAVSPDNVIFLHPEPSPTAKYLDQSVDLETLRIPFARFPGIKRVVPEREGVCLSWSAFVQETAPDPAPVFDRKDQVPYFIAGTLKEAELKNPKLRERRLKKGQSTIGKQRSGAHIDTLGPALLMDDDGDVFRREAMLRALGAAAVIYSSYSFGFPKGEATEPAGGGRVVLVLNRNVTTAEYPFVWDAVNHLSGGGFDEHGRSSALCYGQHARRNDQAPYRRLIIDGAALNADALIELGRTLRPERGGAAPRHKKGAEHKRARIEEVERARLMGNVLPPDDYNHWMSGAGAFKRAFPGDPEAAFTCFDAWAACSSKYQGSQAAHSKFDEVAADYEGTAAPVTLEMLHWRTRRRAEARKQAKKLLTEAPTRNPAMSFATAYENYKQSIAGLRPKTQAEYKRFLDKYFVPQIGRKRLAELQYEEVIACVKDGAKSEAAHALAVCRTFLRWCVRLPRRYLIHSPLEGVQVKFGNKRKRILKPEELKTVWGAAQEQGYPYGTIVQLLIALGQRRGETANLSWEWINETDRTITLPETITKNHKEHTFPYGDLVAAILETIPRRNSTDLLFPSRVSEERPISGWSKFKADLGDGLPAWRLHDLRRTFRTTLAEIGTPAEIAERLINHAAAVQTDVESIYDRYHYMPQMRKAVEAFDEHFRVLLKKADGRSNLLAA